ncbi:MAG: hypothetical protein GYA24_09710, partial [Candidatus Lokiarchaeota archaeon]|nr:hypothetical protein [Candidatus Lokiarchaeota archaeon]
MSEKNLTTELKKELLDAFNLPTKGLKRRENTIMTRVNHDDLQVMEALVELGIFKSISESAAFLIHDSIASKQNYYHKILKIFREIKSKKLEAVATLLESVKEEKMQIDAELSAAAAKENIEGSGAGAIDDDDNDITGEKEALGEAARESMG